MIIKIIEFEDKYPNYDLSFKAQNPLTDTEKLLGRHKALTYIKNAQGYHTYQEYWLGRKLMGTYVEEILPEEDKIAFIKLPQANCTLIGVRRGDSIYAVCDETHERILLTQGLWK